MMEYQLSGFKELDEALRNMPRAIAGRAVTKGLVAAGAVFTAALKQAAPVRATGEKPKKIKSGGVRLRGYLKANVKASKPFRDRKTGTYAIKMSPGKAFYGRFLEFGDKRMRPHPFFLRALGGVVPQAIDRLGAVIAEAIRDYAAKSR
jgi:HK97 gp10 family phage protein